MRQKVLLYGCAVAMAAATAGCGGSAPDTPADNSRVTGSAEPGASDSASADGGKVTISDVAFGQDQYQSMAVGTVANPTADAVSISVNFAAYDRGGKVLDTESGAYVILRATSSQIVATDLSVPEGSKIARVDAQVAVDDSQKDDHPDSKMTIANVDLLKKYGSYTATGEIASTYQDTVSNVYVGISCVDQAGNILGGGYTFLESNVVGGSRAPFSTGIVVSKQPAKCSGSATLSNLSESK